MTDILDRYGKLTAPDTLRIERLLPGPIDRVWSYLTQSEKRRKWLASGEMTLTKGAEFQLTWRNDELTTPSGQRPDGFAEEHHMTCRIIDVDAPRRLAFTWGEKAEVEITLEPQGDKVLLTLVHKRLGERGMLVMVSSGWHAHLDVLRSNLEGTHAAPFWESWQTLRDDYDRRIPA